MDNVSQLTDDQIILAVGEAARVGEASDLLTCSFTIGGTEKKPLFLIQVLAGFDGTSEPADFVDSFLQYEKLSIKLFFWQPMPPLEEIAMADMTFPVTQPDGTVQNVTVKFDVHCFPHTAIEPGRHEAFKDQPWAKDFRYGTIGYITKVDKATICAIIRHCDKISRLTMFW